MSRTQFDRRRWLRTCAIAGALSFSLPNQCFAKEPEPRPGYDFGQTPEWGHARRLIEEHIRGMLLDPESARFEWPNGFKQGSYKPLFDRRQWGYVTCGIVNARNKLGGYAGRHQFVAVMHFDSLVFYQLDDRAGGAVQAQCDALGTFPHAPTGEEQASESGFGFALSVVPDGAYIASTLAGGPAAGAGLKPGMVIAQINGVSLKGMELDLINRLLDATDGPTTLTIVGGYSFRLSKAELPVSTQHEASEGISPDDPDYEKPR